MLHKIILGTVFTVCLSGIFIISSDYAEARHGGSSYSRQIENLDDDSVEALFIPVLFGLGIKDISPNFGDMRGDGTRLHEGQDIMAVLGTPIVTPTEAVVTSVGFGESAGNYVYTANPGGEKFRYMHLDEIADIKVGDVLKKGDFIGTVGDTGNAKGAGAHLHFEIRTNKAIDPFPRIQEELTLKEKVALVKRMFSNLDKEEEMAEFLVLNFQNEFQKALNSGYDLPSEIKSELKKEGIVDNSKLVAQLEKVIASIPKLVTKDLASGDSGVEVGLIQLFLIYKKTGPAASMLARSGATGYFGQVTKIALEEYQESVSVDKNGIYDADTRSAMIAN